MTGLDALPNAYVENYLIIVVALAFLFAMRRFVNEDVGLVFGRSRTTTSRSGRRG
jgi:branched-chain amino acid transport system permease protein